MIQKLPTIDICMIVKNEEYIISRTLENNLICADNVIVVDTGSTDSTRDICKKMGAIVFDFKWENDFSKARNYSISKAKSDWILWLDADELIDKDEFENLRKFLLSFNGNVLYVDVCECQFGTKMFFTKYQRPKIFKNNIGIKFIKPVNEQLFIPLQESYYFYSGFKIYHWGRFLPADKMQKKSIDRIKNFLEIYNKEKDPFIGYILAMHYENLEKYNDAMLILDMILNNMEKNCSSYLLQSLVHAIYYKKAMLLHNLNDVKNAIKFLDEAITINRNFIEPYILKSFLLIKEQKYGEAIKLLLPITRFKKITHPILGFNELLWEDHLYYNIAFCYQKLNKLFKAIKYYKKILEKHESPDVKRMVGMLEKVLFKDSKT